MTPEETLQKAKDKAIDNGYIPPIQNGKCDGWYITINRLYMIFDRSFRESLVGKEFVYPTAKELSSTGYVKSILSDEHKIEVEMSVADYHLQRIAVSDDRIWYLWQVLLDLERK